ncbi:serine/threonine protein phosphatase [Plectonema cf. radiosum LEGE 06105]|uniref:Serine/threonine protein phosphatase n=1 Tax=Plectonema cf. radiosum LEGE 06105 TaxID=945769 RepID=A0A8J7FCZ3_9CYAN|nr:metallophosphoesterase family protein [Plectonema radiosum]MBE9211991.1 serine/threonine protein phosphatase [Plectonema cf. radiosum LEGE 06105]
MCRRIFIGDVHGHYDGLMLLLNVISPDRDDRVYFLGDLINRGPKSAQVVEFVRKSPYYCVLGNHEQMLLDYFQDKQVINKTIEKASCTYKETIDSYLKSDISLLPVHLEWFSNLPLYLDLGDIWAVHGGVNPQLALDKQSQKEFCWIRQPFHSMSKPYFPDKLIIVGHTPTFKIGGVIPGKLVQGKGWLDIDTGAYDRRSGWLTALDMTNSIVYQANVFSRKTRVSALSEIVEEIG